MHFTCTSLPFFCKSFEFCRQRRGSLEQKRSAYGKSKVQAATEPCTSSLHLHCTPHRVPFRLVSSHLFFIQHFSLSNVCRKIILIKSSRQGSTVMSNLSPVALSPSYSISRVILSHPLPPYPIQSSVIIWYACRVSCLQRPFVSFLLRDQGSTQRHSRQHTSSTH